VTSENNWRAIVNEFPIEQKILLEGGNLSTRFSKLPLTFSHPVFLGSFYGLLLSLVLLLPFGYESNWDLNKWFIGWLFYSLSLLLILSLLGGISSLFVNFTKRMPIAIPRILVYFSPFLGLIFLTLSISLSNIPFWVNDLGLFLMIFPGPVYIHLSWAPRWRLLNMLEQNINPFENNVDLSEIQEDIELNEIVEDFSQISDNS